MTAGDDLRRTTASLLRLARDAVRLPLPAGPAIAHLFDDPAALVGSVYAGSDTPARLPAQAPGRTPAVPRPGAWSPPDGTAGAAAAGRVASAPLAGSTGRSGVGWWAGATEHDVAAGPWPLMADDRADIPPAGGAHRAAGATTGAGAGRAAGATTGADARLAGHAAITADAGHAAAATIGADTSRAATTAADTRRAATIGPDTHRTGATTTDADVDRAPPATIGGYLPRAGDLRRAARASAAAGAPGAASTLASALGSQADDPWGVTQQPHPRATVVGHPTWPDMGDSRLPAALSPADTEVVDSQRLATDEPAPAPWPSPPHDPAPADVPSGRAASATGTRRARLANGAVDLSAALTTAQAPHERPAPAPPALSTTAAAASEPAAENLPALMDRIAAELEFEFLRMYGTSELGR